MYRECQLTQKSTCGIVMGVTTYEFKENNMESFLFAYKKTNERILSKVQNAREEDEKEDKNSAYKKVIKWAKSILNH